MYETQTVRNYVLLKKYDVSLHHDSPIVTYNIKCVTVLIFWTTFLSRQVYQYFT
jgi:hypothetical protein